MIEHESLLGRKTKRNSPSSIFIIFSLAAFSTVLLLFCFAQPHVVQNEVQAREVPVGSGRCVQITCPETMNFPMCRRSKLDADGQPMPTIEPCRIKVERQLDYDTKVCAAAQCTFTECCMVTVWYAQQFASSCGAAALLSAELELGYHNNILRMDVQTAWDAVKAREESIYVRTDDSYRRNREVNIDTFVDVDLMMLQGNLQAMLMATQWAQWPKVLGDQFEGRNHLYLYNAPATLSAVLTTAFNSLGASWNRKPLTEAVHEMRDNERVLALVRPPDDNKGMHWVLIRPDGSIMDPATCGSFRDIASMEASTVWQPVYDVAIKVIAPDPARTAQSIPRQSMGISSSQRTPSSSSGMSRSGAASMNLADLAGALEDIGSAGLTRSRRREQLGGNGDTASSSYQSAYAHQGSTSHQEDQITDLPNISRRHGSPGSFRSRSSGSGSPRMGGMFSGSPPLTNTPRSGDQSIPGAAGGSAHGGYYFNPATLAAQIRNLPPSPLAGAATSPAINLPPLQRRDSEGASSAAGSSISGGKRRVGERDAIPQSLSSGIPLEPSRSDPLPDTLGSPSGGMRRVRTSSDIRGASSSGSGSGSSLSVSAGPGSNPLPFSSAQAAQEFQQPAAFSAPLPGSILSAASASSQPGSAPPGVYSPQSGGSAKSRARKSPDQMRQSSKIRKTSSEELPMSPRPDGSEDLPDAGDPEGDPET